MFRRYRDADDATVRIDFDGETLEAATGETVAAALLANGVSVFRSSPVSGVERGPYCMIGACFECLVEIDGAANIQACQTAVKDGMRVRRQLGAVDTVS